MKSKTQRTRMSLRGALAIGLGALAVVIPATASGHYGGAADGGAGHSQAAEDSGLVVPDHAALNASVAPAGGSSAATASEGPTLPPVTAPLASADAFDWADAVLGAGVAMALAGLVGTALLVARRRAAISPTPSIG